MMVRVRQLLMVHSDWYIHSIMNHEANMRHFLPPVIQFSTLKSWSLRLPTCSNTSSASEALLVTDPIVRNSHCRYLVALRLLGASAMAAMGLIMADLYPH
jgi:hypothetical protein